VTTYHDFHTKTNPEEPLYIPGTYVIVVPIQLANLGGCVKSSKAVLMTRGEVRAEVIGVVFHI
jgi:hypothetical protein